MKLLLSERKLVIGISENIEFGEWGNVSGAKSWKIGNSQYAMDNNFTVVDIGDKEIPTYVVEGEYYYINDEFKLGDECPNEYKDKIMNCEERIGELEIYNADLLYQVCLLQLGLTEDDLL